MKYVIRDRIAGNVIEKFNTYQEALDILNKYEAGGEEEDIYDPDFYEIVEEEEICYAREFKDLDKTIYVAKFLNVVDGGTQVTTKELCNDNIIVNVDVVSMDIAAVREILRKHGFVYVKKRL